MERCKKLTLFAVLFLLLGERGGDLTEAKRESCIRHSNDYNYISTSSDNYYSSSNNGDNNNSSNDNDNAASTTTSTVATTSTTTTTNFNR